MSAESTVIHISQGIDYLGFLNAKLRDLKGWATLANELIQNADDARDATRVTFDVTTNALIVENDAQFSDCGAVEATRCGLDPVGDGKVCCDFHAFRRVASGHKRQESDTTGAFGIGFISVYQITDQPKLLSGQWQWGLRPEAIETERIAAVRLAQPFSATRFELPWARTQTSLRTALGIEPVAQDVADQMCAELRKALTVAAPFLKRLETLELRRRGQVELIVRCLRDPSACEIVVEAGEETHFWKRLGGNFSQEAAELRARFGTSIEAKRKTEVTVAVPIDTLPAEGRLYAALPTEHDIALPVLINGDFYPSSDRKRILFDQDYQGDWNRAVVRAAARALAKALPDLRELLEPVDLWKMLWAAKKLHRDAVNNIVDKAFASFWEYLAPIVRSGEFVRTTREDWCAPLEARLLQSAKDEASVLPLLEELDLKVVHLDMQPFATLLRDKEVGVGYLTLDDLTSGLLTGGYDQILPMDQVAPWLRSAENRSVLSQEVALLLERVAKDAKSGAREKARRCALVLTTDDALAPAAVLRESSTATRDVFANVAPAEYWATNNNPPDLLDLVSQFSVRDAISLLRSAGQEKLELCNLSDSGWIVRVVGWFAANRAFVAADPDVQSAIRALSIWPSGEGLCSLDRLSVPGDFEDGLKLARILDPHISSRWASFLLEDLGARKLDLETYLIEHAPRAFEKEPLPDLDTRRALLRVLVAHAGDLLDEQNIATALRQLPIVECQDGQFHRPIGTYFENSLVLEVLGSTAPLAKLPDEKQMATRDVLQWLGVSDFPRAHDVLQRVENLTNQGPSADRREAIRSLFKGLAENWENLADKHDDLEELQRMAWLPGHRSTSWLPPSSVYSVFSRFLFETQAEFLDIPVLVQRVAADGLLRFLQIRSEPDVILVVKHLLQVAQHGDGVNMQVYEFLNRHALDQKINLLKGKACLYLSDGSYVEGGVCYWGTHPFGQNRIHLNQDWRKYQPLLTQLGVSESPTALDALQVLGEISEAYTDNRQLENEDHQVVMSCWSLLSEKLDDIPDLAESLASLKVVPNASHYLRKPCDVFFDDRPGLADKFDEAFRKLVIRRPETSWRAMATAGVRFLSSAVKMELVQCSDPILDEAMGQRLQERWPLVRRVFATLVDMPEGLTVPPELWGSDRLTVNYRILNYPGPTEDVVAHLTEARLRMYFCRGRMNVWGAIARELAFGFYPDVAAGPLAAAIKEVLQSADVEEARAGLDDLGIPEVALDSIDEPVSEDAGLGMGAGHNAGMGEESSGFDASTCESNAKADEEDFNDSSDESETGTADETGGAKPKWVRERGERGAGTQHGNGEGGKPKDRGHKPASVKTLREGYTFVGRSYLKPECENEDTELSEEAKARRADSDRQGIDKVLKSELQDGRQPTEMPHDNEGYDIESRAPEGQIVRYIEVKSLTGPWNGFGVKLSAPQFRMAQAKQDAYWLYVVEKATSADANIYRIQNPASKVVEYRFDDGWQLVAEEESTHQRRSILDVLSRNPASGDEMDEEIVGEKTPLLEDD